MLLAGQRDHQRKGLFTLSKDEVDEDTLMMAALDGEISSEDRGVLDGLLAGDATVRRQFEEEPPAPRSPRR